jgi:hypothetical protein
MPGPAQPPEVVHPRSPATPGPAPLSDAPGAVGADRPRAARVDRPAWLGSRALPERPDGYGRVGPTPPELVDRRLPPPPGAPSALPTDTAFAATIAPVPDVVAARSTWTSACPVDLDELRYVTVTFWGFDQRAHTGELLVNDRVADDVAWAFEQLYEARFPIEEMRVVDAPELDAAPTGDGNNTTAFVCRPAVGQARWSDHAYGLAVDINPFHNPYVRGDLVLPELAAAYTDRSFRRPGMVLSDDVVTSAFAAIGWGWGGDWRSSRDWMHFSASGR